MRKHSVALLLVLASLLLGNLASADDLERPNIVMILCDDLGYADVGFNGSTDIPTPSLDGLAKSGTVFSSMYVPHPFCGPSRAGLMTGRYPHCLGSQFNLPQSGVDLGADRGVPTGETFISKVLQDAGYSTGLVGKWHLGKTPKYHPNKRGFDDFYGFLGGGHLYFPQEYRAKYKRQTRNGKGKFWSYVGPLEHNGVEVSEDEYLTDALSSEGARFVREASGDPFFLFMSYNAPHAPLQAKQEDYDALSNIADTQRRTYAAMVAAVDRGVGVIVDELKASGQFENTLIVFFSDNGGKTSSGGNNAPLRGSKGDVAEGGFRVPMFFHWPGHVDAGKKYPHPVSALDFYPTFARLAKAAVPKGKQLDGKDIWDDVVAARSPRPNKPIFALRHRNGDNEIGVRQDQWKLFRSKLSGWQLFDVENDISETNDVSKQHPKVLQAMIAQAEKWTHEHQPPLWFDSQKVSDSWFEQGMPNFKKTFGNAWTSASTTTAPATRQANNISSISFGAGSEATDVHVYEGGKADKGYLDFQVTHQSLLPQMAPNIPSMTIDNLKVSRLPQVKQSEPAAGVLPVGQSGNWKLIETMKVDNVRTWRRQ